MKDIYDIIVESNKRAGEPLALATLINAEGSSYRRPGARLLISTDGRTVGSLSGGCIEDEIAMHARSVLESGRPLLIDFDTRRMFGCHGKLHIFIEKLDPELLPNIARQLDQRQYCVLVTTSEGSRVHNDYAPDAVNVPQDLELKANGPHRSFVQMVHPPLRLLIFGEGPDTTPLQKLAAALGWGTIQAAEPSTVILEPDAWTAAIVKSHNYGRDFTALARLLPMNLRYVGLIGPKKRRDELLNELLQIGVGMNAGFFAPAGLDLNAETPEEIALSIVSEIQRVFGEGSGQSLRDRKLPIHYINPTESATKAAWPASAP